MWVGYKNDLQFLKVEVIPLKVLPDTSGVPTMIRENKDVSQLFF
jgi:hypothetical protein